MLRLLARTLLAGLFMILAVSAAGGQSPPPMTTIFEGHDGRIYDQAASTLLTTLPNFHNQRLWIAQGRTRASHALDNLAHQASEDRKFNQSNSPGNFERVVAVEVDHVNQRLYTLTDRALYRQDTMPPPGPITEVVLDLLNPASRLLNWDPNGVPPNFESTMDLAVWGTTASTTTRVMVLTTKRIFVIEDTGLSLMSLLGQTGELSAYSQGSVFTPSTCSLPDDFNSRGVGFLQQIKVMMDANGKVMAYVLAEATGFVGVGRPRPWLLLLCHLDAGATPWTAPTFDADPSPSVVNYAWWDPLPLGFSGPGARSYTAYDMDVASVGLQRFVYVGCGHNNQLAKVDVSNAFPRNCAANPQLPATLIPLASVLANPPAAGPTIVAKNILNVLVDHSNQNRIFAITDQLLYVYDGLLNQSFIQADEAFGQGSPGDLVQVNIATSQSPRKRLYTMGLANVNPTNKQIDVTLNNLSTTVYPRALFNYPRISSSDGAVMIGDRVIIPTWSGVLKYDPSNPGGGTIWTDDPSSFQSSEESPHVPFVNSMRGTEHIDVATVPGTARPDRVITASINGGFDEFAYNPTTNTMEPLNRVTPTLVPTVPPWSWPLTNGYGNDLAFVEMGDGQTEGTQFVITDLSEFAPGSAAFPRRSALLAFKWDISQWPHRWVNHVFQDTYFYDPNIPGAGLPLTDTIAITKVVNTSPTPDKWFAFVGTGESIYSADITNIQAATPSITYVGGHLCVPGFQVRAGGAYAVQTSLPNNQGRLFVYVYGHGTTPPEMRTYKWDTQTGAIDNTVLAHNFSFSIATPGEATYTLGSGFRMRYDLLDPVTGAGNLYQTGTRAFGNTAVLLRMNWNPTALNPDPPLTFTGTWQSDTEDALQDCRVYTLPGGTKVVLVSKDRESFAVINP